MANIVKTRTPHAAVLIWNYEDRLGTEDTKKSQVNDTRELIISTVSLVSIRTTKNKGEPVGRFEISLAPTKNWVETITAGSWMCIMMSQNPITKDDLAKAHADKVKFIGKVESVRMEMGISDPESGARQTTFTVTGVDWAHIFENNTYIDPFIEKENNSVGAATYIDLFNRVIGVDSRAEIFTTRKNLLGILEIIGKPLSKGFLDQAEVLNQVAKVDFSFAMPVRMKNFFDFNNNGKTVNSTNIIDAIQLITGTLIDVDKYKDVAEASGFINPASFKGVNTLWQLLIDNSCPLLNEMMADIRWNKNGRPTLALYNRIKPFAFRATNFTEQRLSKALEKETFGSSDGSKINQRQTREEITTEIRKIISKYQRVRTTKIPLEDVININAGTNWRDKFNFAEIKPSWQIFDTLSSWAKSVGQTADVQAFKREGFRPLIIATKQFPTAGAKKDMQTPNSLWVNINLLAGWKHLLREWYFDTHRLLNGTMTIIGQNDYIQVGDNVKVDFNILGRTHNMNKGVLNAKEAFLLAHVESISHSFRVTPDGARTWSTTINFVRGIIVSDNGSLVGEGKLDSKASSINSSQDRNSNNVIGTSTALDPDPQKLKGT